MRPSTHSTICAEIQLEHQKRERRLLARIDELTQERDALLELQQECWKLQAAIETVRSERDRLTDAIAAAQAPAPGAEPPPNIARLMGDLEALAREIEATHYPDAILLAVNELRRLAGAEHELREDVATLEGALAEREAELRRLAVQAPAVAHEPLTDEQIHSLYDEVARSEPYAGAVTRRKVVRAIERAHGIGTFDVPVQGSEQ